MKKYRPALFLSAFLLFGFALTLFSSEVPDGSTYSTKPGGAAALFETLQKVEFSLTRLHYPFSKLSEYPANTALVIISPSIPPAAKGLKAWAEKGNAVFYFPARGVLKDPIFEEFGIEVRADPQDAAVGIVSKAFTSEGDFHCPKGREALCGNVRRLTDNSTFPITRIGNGSAVRTAVGLHTAAYLKLDKGSAWLFTDSSPALNETIDRLDNFVFLHSALSQFDLVVFDEFHHGFSAPAEGAVGDRLLLLFAFTIYFVVWLVLSVSSRAVRFGPPKTTADVSPVASTEFIHALGLLYARRQVVSVLGYYIDAWRKRVVESLGGVVGCSAKDVVCDLERRGLLTPKGAQEMQNALIAVSTKQSGGEMEASNAVTILERILNKSLKGAKHERAK